MAEATEGRAVAMGPSAAELTPTGKSPRPVVSGELLAVGEASVEEMQQKIAGSKLVILPESGHMTFVDQPGLYLKSVGDFLK